MNVAPTSSSLPLVLFSGIGGGPSLLDRQRGVSRRVITPAWIDPSVRESLADYACRMAGRIDWPRVCAIGGVSFGGMVAAEIAAQRQRGSLNRPAKIRGVILIASSPSPPPTVATRRFMTSMMRALTSLLAWEPTDCERSGFPRQFNNVFGQFDAADQWALADMLREANAGLLRQGAAMLADWPGVEPVALPGPLLHIHGAKDVVFPLEQVKHQPDMIVPAAGHLVHWTHAKEVNEAIQRFLKQTSGPSKQDADPGPAHG